ncbi:MAG: OmpA family protein [Bacteroidetes bacterium]|nr:OmpA family protein [Bacteroidota bacterium]
MLRFLCTAISVTVLHSWSSAQNLVPNPGFEEYDYLPCERTRIRHPEDFGLKSWSWPTWASPDVFSTAVKEKCWNYACKPGEVKTAAGHQLPRTGNVMTGIYTWGLYNYNEYHEYLQAELTEALIPGKNYHVEFRVCRSCLVNKASNNIGAFFSEKAIERKNIISLNFDPQINETEIISESGEWTLISGSFKAEKPYRYLLIGNFFKDSDTETQVVPTCNGHRLLYIDEAYYYIDDVVVSAVETLQSGNIAEDTSRMIRSEAFGALDTGKIAVLDKIYFELDSDSLLPESYTQLDKLYDLLVQYPAVSIEIAGHTDTSGSPGYNLDLSERRAKAVTVYLITKGIDKKRLSHKGYGEARPVAGEPRPQDGQKQRMVEFRIVGR